MILVIYIYISLSTGNNYTYNPKNNITVVLNHINYNNCKATLDNFLVISVARNDFLRCLKESLLILLHKPILNKCEKHATTLIY